MPVRTGRLRAISTLSRIEPGCFDANGPGHPPNPATSDYRDAETGVLHRHHLHLTVVQKAVRSAALRSRVAKPVVPRCFRHACATDMLHAGYDVRRVQQFLGHKSVKTTTIYTHPLERGGHR